MSHRVRERMRNGWREGGKQGGMKWGVQAEAAMIALLQDSSTTDVQVRVRASKNK